MKKKKKSVSQSNDLSNKVGYLMLLFLMGSNITMQELYFIFDLNLPSKLNQNVVRSYGTALAAATHALISSHQFLAACQKDVSR